MANKRIIPGELVGMWQDFRHERAQLRQHLYGQASRFWTIIPRRKRRIMPVVGFTDEKNWMEPEPLAGLGFKDRLGLTMRWRMSDVIPDGTGPTRKLVAIWAFDLPRGVVPNDGMLRAGGISDPADLENYRYYWRTLHEVHEHYVYLGRWFDELVAHWSERHGRRALLRESCGVEEGQTSADGKSPMPLGKKGKHA